MLFPDSLEVAIGVSFVFLLLSFVLASVHEAIETVLKTRGRRLLDGITEMLASGGADDGKDAARVVYTHPLLQGLLRGTADGAIDARSKLPSYIPARNFALALIDQAITGKLAPASDTATLPARASTAEQLALAAERIENPQLRRALAQAVEVGRGDIERTRAHIEAWYDSSMDRVSGWYKRRTQRILFVLGLGVALALNVNALSLIETLSNDAALRRALTEQAASVTPAVADNAVAQLKTTGLPIGWSDEARSQAPRLFGGETETDALGFLQLVTGYLITAFAVMLGAPFWFDVLNRLMVIRATVKPTEKSQDEAPQDPQAGKRDAKLLVVTPPGAPPPPPPVADPDAMDDDIYAELPGTDDRAFDDEEDGR